VVNTSLLIFDLVGQMLFYLFHNSIAVNSSDNAINWLICNLSGTDFFRQKSKPECKTGKGNFKDLTKGY